MLKNFFNSIFLKNLFKSGFYLDFFFKKYIESRVTKIISFNIFFQEKIILERVFLYFFIQVSFIKYFFINFFKKKDFLLNLIKIIIILIHLIFLFI